MSRFPARHRVPEFAVFASLLRVSTKYGFSDVREALVEDLKGAYPTKWGDFETARVLGEDIFGPPIPHPNEVLNLFVAQGIRFAIPFASYRASLGGFAALMSDKPGTVLPRHTLACTIYGTGMMQHMRPINAYKIGCVTTLTKCPERSCILNVGTNHGEQRMEALWKLSGVMFGERQGGLLRTPSLGDLTCAKCTEKLESYHAEYSSACWDVLPVAFKVAKSWDDL